MLQRGISMRIKLALLIFVFCITPKAVWGQEVESDQPLKDQWIRDWVKMYKDWQVDQTKFFDASERRYWLVKVFMEADRNKGVKPPKFYPMFKPSAPPFLGDLCASVQTKGSAYFEACELLEDSRDDLATKLIRRQIQSGVNLKEADPKTSFAKRVHVDGGWTAPYLPFPHIYGVIGMHVGWKTIGRSQLYMLPGGMVVTYPVGVGSRAFRPALTWGGSIRLFGLKPFWSVHLNMAAVRILGMDNPLGMPNTNSTVGMMGFSITPFGKD